MIHTTKRYTAKEHIFFHCRYICLCPGKEKLHCRCPFLGKAKGKVNPVALLFKSLMSAENPTEEIATKTATDFEKIEGYLKDLAEIRYDVHNYTVQFSAAYALAYGELYELDNSFSVFFIHKNLHPDEIYPVKKTI